MIQVFAASELPDEDPTCLVACNGGDNVLPDEDPTGLVARNGGDNVLPDDPRQVECNISLAAFLLAQLGLS